LFATANGAVVTMLHSLNTLAAMPALQVFDGADFSQLLNSGMITLGMGGVSDWAEGADTLAKTILSLYQSATLADMDTSHASQGVCVIAAGSNVYEKFSNEELMRGLDMIRNSSSCSTMMLHSGLYELPGKKRADTLQVYVGLGGLQLNPEVLKQLAKVGVVPDFESKLANFFGIK
jgi:cell division GTPase FtsZ